MVESNQTSTYPSCFNSGWMFRVIGIRSFLRIASGWRPSFSASSAAFFVPASWCRMCFCLIMWVYCSFSKYQTLPKSVRLLLVSRPQKPLSFLQPTNRQPKAVALPLLRNSAIGWSAGLIAAKNAAKCLNSGSFIAEKRCASLQCAAMLGAGLRCTFARGA